MKKIDWNKPLEYCSFHHEVRRVTYLRKEDNRGWDNVVLLEYTDGTLQLRMVDNFGSDERCCVFVRNVPELEISPGWYKQRNGKWARVNGEATQLRRPSNWLVEIEDDDGEWTLEFYYPDGRYLVDSDPLDLVKRVCGLDEDPYKQQ